MKYECDIVKDLMPLYIDDVLSENSKTFVKDHMDSCKSCKKYYEKLSNEIKIPVRRRLFQPRFQRRVGAGPGPR